MHELRLQRRFDAPPGKVFAEITDHAGMNRWLDGAKVTVEKQGHPPPNGLGAVRRIAARGLRIDEEVVLWEEPRAMDYRVVRGAPLRDHLGELRLEPSGDGGTLLDYRIRFRVPWYFGGAALGSILVRQLEREIGRGLAKLARLL